VPLRKQQTVCFRSFASCIGEEIDRGLAVALLNGSQFPDLLYFVQQEHFCLGAWVIGTPATSKELAAFTTPSKT
jgi:hypothetical protein